MTLLHGMDAYAKAEQSLQSKLRELGQSKAVDRFLLKYGNVRTKATYALEIALYMRWLKREKEVSMTPDQLVQDNLECVFKSDPTDVQTKRRHTDWLSEYVNRYLLDNDFSESKRMVASAAITGFYRSNDARLVGDYQAAIQAPEAPPRALYPEDIRKVLKAMPLRTRTPLLIVWQSAIEINRVLATDFKVDGPGIQKVELYGRKGHRRGYWTYLGRESVEHLRMLGGKGFSNYATVRKSLVRAARRLGKSGLLKNPDLRSWHPHALRHSFSTECSHAGVNPEVREFFMGHVSGIAWVYQHPEVHEDDILSEYKKVEPHVSLDYTEITVREEYEGREKAMTQEIVELRRLYHELKSELQAAQGARPSARAGV